jgi:phosphoribosyl 1,2-cyclic phosphate phosphodiesterase
MIYEENSGEFIITGCGTSVGVPVIGCDCETCRSTNPRNQRTRTGVVVRAPEGIFVIDTGPEFRLQLVRERIPVVHAAIYTHNHADHIFGLDDLRICGHRLDRAIPLYCEEAVERAIRQSFNYAFAEEEPLNPHKYALPRLRFERIGEEPFRLLGLLIRPIRLMHGNLPVLGFRINDVAFCTDVSYIPESSWPLLEGLDVLILDALREKPHPTHFCLCESLEVVERLKPRRVYFTHLSCSLEYEKTNAQLPPGVELAYDGLRIPL